MYRFISGLLKRPMFYISSIMVMFGMTGIAEEIAWPGYTRRLGPVHGTHSGWGVYIVCACIVLVGLIFLYRVTLKIAHDEE
jgi:divalent metal cation (Fe/Co/Zn/Cd) transporter